MAERLGGLEPRLVRLAERALERAERGGATGARVLVSQRRTVHVKVRDGKLERLQEARSSRLTLHLFVDGRFSSSSTSDLREAPIDGFVEEAVAATKRLTPDEHRTLPPEELCRGYPDPAKLGLVDDALERLTPEQRRSRAFELEAETREATGRPVVSVTTDWIDTSSRGMVLMSNGASATVARTSMEMWAEATVDDPETGRKPSGWSGCGVRQMSELLPIGDIAKDAARRALEQRGAKPVRTRKTHLLVENRAARTLLSHLLRPMFGYMVQQERSCLADKLGAKVASERLGMIDDPLLPGALGTRVYDPEGMAARPLVLFDHGVLKSFYLDVPYAGRLGMKPTTGSPSNVCIAPGSKTLEQLVSGLDDGVLVRSFLGGNSNSTTGDFSLGIVGHEISKGKIVGPIAESNISGNLLDLWQHLDALGSDLWTYSSVRRPSLLFSGVQVSGV